MKMEKFIRKNGLNLLLGLVMVLVIVLLNKFASSEVVFGFIIVVSLGVLVKLLLTYRRYTKSILLITITILLMIILIKVYDIKVPSGEKNVAAQETTSIEVTPVVAQVQPTVLTLSSTTDSILPTATVEQIVLEKEEVVKEKTVKENSTVKVVEPAEVNVLPMSIPTLTPMKVHVKVEPTETPGEVEELYENDIIETAKDIRVKEEPFVVSVVLPTVLPSTIPLPTDMPTAIPTETPIVIPAIVVEPTQAPVYIYVPTAIPTPTPVVVPTIVLQPTQTPVATPVPTAIPTPVVIPTIAVQPTPTPVPTAIPTPTVAPVQKVTVKINFTELVDGASEVLATVVLSDAADIKFDSNVTCKPIKISDTVYRVNMTIPVDGSHGVAFLEVSGDNVVTNESTVNY